MFLSSKMDTMHKPLNHNSNNLSPLISNFSDCLNLSDDMVIASDFEKLEKSVFTYDAMPAMLVSKNNKMETILVTQTSPVGVELFSCLKASFCCKIFFATAGKVWAKMLNFNQITPFQRAQQGQYVNLRTSTRHWTTLWWPLSEAKCSAEKPSSFTTFNKSGHLCAIKEAALW